MRTSRWMLVLALAMGWTVASQAQEHAAPPAEEVAAEPSGHVSGRVFDAATGEPLAEAVVDLVVLRDIDSRSDGWLKRGDGWQYRTDYRTETDSAGRYELGPVDEGPYRLRVKRDGYGPVMKELEVGSVPLEGIDFPLGPTVGLHIRVSGEVSRWVRVALFDQAGRMVLLNNYEPGVDGEVHLTTAPAGAWQLWVNSANSAWERVDVQVPGEEALVVLKPGASVTFTVPAVADEVADLRMNLRTPEGRPLPAMVGGDARFQSLEDYGYLANLWPGEWVLELRHPDGREWSTTFTARAGELTQLELH